MFSKSLNGLELRALEVDGRLRQRLGAGTTLTPQEVERAFTLAFDDLAFGRPLARDVLAHLVLLRELVHHGSLTAVLIPR
jgi:hypothetical protein